MLRGLVIILLLIALAPAFARAEIPRKIADIIRAEAEHAGLDAVLLLVIAELESGGDPRAMTGSYEGLFQLGSRGPVGMKPAGRGVAHRYRVALTS